ncbi:prostaglandin D2 receptor isoform 2-T2 [Anomaloglossus baeobatrachus]|uniref:prostaglandin D2 receptor isoform X2 n=1 Tax=Anomaloglossus baeobatrachus TaxID=238106 RepID=UPI003F4F9792
MMSLHNEPYRCSDSRAIQEDYSVIPSSLLFSAGLLGNIIAIFILWQHKLRSRKKTSIFYILVTGLTVTNLLGKCLVSPMVTAAYSKNQTLVEMVENRTLCDVFSFFMIFFGLAPMLILLAMALDCWIALAHPFFYHMHITKRFALLVPVMVYVFSAVFCAMPFFGIGKFEQYCPGTWCFIQMTAEHSDPKVLAYSLLYGTVIGLLVVAIIICNVGTMRRLYHMYQVQNTWNSIKLAPKFRVYIGAFTKEKNEYADLIVLRFLSINSILDPWLFIICRTSKFHTHVHSLCSWFHSTSNTQSQLLDESTKSELCDVSTKSELCDVSTKSELCDVSTKSELCDVSTKSAL